MTWTIHHRAVTASTNQDAAEGQPGEVFTADEQTAGRGRLDHRWLSAPGENLMMSAVVGVAGLAPETVATFPLVTGLAVVRAVVHFIGHSAGGAGSTPRVCLKWPNDVLVEGHKIAGILCERHGDRLVAGIGVNVWQSIFPVEIASRATSLVLSGGDAAVSPTLVRDAVLAALGALYDIWRERGFAAVWPEIAAVDYLKGRQVTVRQTDQDAQPQTGHCGGICADGTLDVEGHAIWAGEVCSM